MKNKIIDKKNFIQFFISKSDSNCVRCSKCNILFINAHLICFRVFRINNVLYWESKYTVGCSQKDSNNNKWCNDCLTICNNKIYCLECLNMKYNNPDFSDTTRKWLWIDGSISSISDLFINGDNDWNIVEYN